MASNNDAAIATPPTRAEPPRGVNHVVLNVRSLDTSHTFWTEIMGFRCVAELTPRPGGSPFKMRFYSGLDERGDVNHHDLALAEMGEADAAAAAEPPEWTMMPRRVGMNHVAITWPDRESWLRQIAFLQSKGVPFRWRVNHGMTHSVYIADPDGHGIEVLYELPRAVWEKDIDAAQNYVEVLPAEGPEALLDRTDNPVFEGTPMPAVAGRA